MTRQDGGAKNEGVGACISAFSVITALLLVLIGAGSLAASIVIQWKDSSLELIRFHIWVGVPLLIDGIIGLVVLFPRKSYLRKLMLLCYGTLSFLLVIVCAFGAVTLGLKLWEDQWDAILDEQVSGCTLEAKTCICSFNIPVNVEDCGDLDLIHKMFIVNISLAAFGCVASIFAVAFTMAQTCMTSRKGAKGANKTDNTLPATSSSAGVRMIGGRPLGSWRFPSSTRAYNNDSFEED